MRIHPTVVIGLGSTGKNILANVERYLYEVLGAEHLDVFRLIVFETATDSAVPGHALTGTGHVPVVDIQVGNIGAAYRGMQDILGSDFDSCPAKLRIEGPGAGNMRAGGRLMLFENMEKVHDVILRAMRDVKRAAASIQAADHVRRLLRDRGMSPAASIFSEEPAFFVVGTLAGGTCSGACIDLGYLLRRVEPGATREGVFVFADANAVDVYKQNSWAALEDLTFFTDNPSAYHAEWLNSARNVMGYSTKRDPGPPYTRFYLSSQRNSDGGFELAYSPSPESPLLMMLGTYITANLVGLHDIRMTRLADINQRVDKGIHEVFLTHSLRGVSYPKYELTEAAAGRIVAEHVCERWLDEETYYINGSS